MALLRLLAVFALEALLVAAVHRLVAAAGIVPARAGLGTWLRTVAPLDACAAIAGVAAVAAGWWLLVGSLLDVAVAAVGVSGLVRARLPLTLPVVRRAVDAVVLGTVVMAALTTATPALADDTVPGTAATVPPTAPVRDGRAHLAAGTGADPALPGPAAVPAPAPTATASGTTAVVVAGDDLWELSARELARATARPRAVLGDAEIARYWARVCTENAAHVRSGDVDLIYPGEEITLPPL